MWMNRILFGLVVVLACSTPAPTQILTYPDPTLQYVYPAGGQQGQTIAVELGGLNGLTGAKNILIDGPPGITVRDVKAVSAAEVRATFVIAPDTVPGCRLVRILGA